MFTVNLIGIGFCILRMFEIFSGGREPEEEGDGTRSSGGEKDFFRNRTPSVRGSSGGRKMFQ